MKKILFLLLIFTIPSHAIYFDDTNYDYLQILREMNKADSAEIEKRNAGLPSTRKELVTLNQLKTTLGEIDETKLNLKLLETLIWEGTGWEATLYEARYQMPNSITRMTTIFLAVMLSYEDNSTRLQAYQAILDNENQANQFLAKQDEFWQAMLAYKTYLKAH